MKQIYVRNVPITDYFLNIFYKIRFGFYRKFYKKKLKNTSSKNKKDKILTFNDDFDKVSWGYSDTEQPWILGEGWGSFHPDKPTVYYGEPKLIKNTSLAKFTVEYKPKTFPDDFKTGKPITIPFKVSLISTPISFKQQYGRFECRCTIPYDRGAFPAFWLWGSTWPPEIDVFELNGGEDGKRAGIQKPDLHWGIVEEGSKKSLPKWVVKIDDISNKNKFHEFAVEWTPTKIKFITDGVTIMRFTGKKELEWFNKDIAKMWIVVNHSINFSNEIYITEKDTNYYSEFLVDYVRAYKFNKYKL